MITAVTDKQGNKYHLSITHISRGVSFTIDGDEGRIGYANIIVEGRSRWQLKDIQIHNDAPPRLNPLIKMIRAWLHLKPITQSYRSRGLGSVLLQSVIAEARKHRSRQIYGSTTADDRRQTPYLMEWYAKNGLREIRRRSGTASDSRVEVQIDLEPLRPVSRPSTRNIKGTSPHTSSDSRSRADNLRPQIQTR